MPPPAPERVADPRVREDRAVQDFRQNSEKMHRASEDAYTKAWFDCCQRPDVNLFYVSTYHCSILFNNMGSFDSKNATSVGRSLAGGQNLKEKGGRERASERADVTHSGPLARPLARSLAWGRKGKRASERASRPWQVLSCHVPFSPVCRVLCFLWMSCSYSDSFCCCCFHLSVAPLTICLVFVLSVFVFLSNTESGSNASLCRAFVDSPGLHTDAKDCTLRAVRALAPTFPLFPLYVYRRQWTG